MGEGFSITVPNSVKLDCLNGHSRSNFFPSPGGEANESTRMYVDFWSPGGGVGWLTKSTIFGKKNQVINEDTYSKTEIELR